MKKAIGYIVILVPIVLVGIRWRAWEGLGFLILSLVAAFLCTAWGDYCFSRENQK